MDLDENYDDDCDRIMMMNDDHDHDDDCDEIMMMNDDDDAGDIVPTEQLGG